MLYVWVDSSTSQANGCTRDIVNQGRNAERLKLF